jgi:hypothetical protein
VHSCVVCKRPIADEQVGECKPLLNGIVCSHCHSELTRIAEMIAKPVSIFKPLTQDDYYCYRVEWNGFVTMVDLRDCAQADMAFDYARRSKLQSWYFDREKVDPDPIVTKITRGQFREWLREGHT